MTTPPAPASGPLDRLRAACSSCSLRELCLPAGLETREIERIDRLVNQRHRVPKGGHLFRAGEPLAALFAVRSGFLKSCVLQEDGREQVAGFHMMGELLGMDAIGSGRHMCDTVALEDSEVCEIPFALLERLSREVPALQHQLHRVMSREIVRDYGVMLLLGSMKAEERLAAFLLNLAQRFAARGYSPTEFILRMTRQDIGSYLGLKLETVSRALSSFQDRKLMEVRNRHVRILDLPGLRRLVAPQR